MVTTAVPLVADAQEKRVFTYSNPLPLGYMAPGELPREVRDPCIIRDGDTYYLVFTMWPFANREDKRMHLPDNGSSPGIALYSSPDLKTWKFENWLVPHRAAPPWPRVATSYKSPYRAP